MNVTGWFSSATLDVIGEGFARVYAAVMLRTNITIDTKPVLASSSGRSITKRIPYTMMIYSEAGCLFTVMMTYLNQQCRYNTLPSLV